MLNATSAVVLCIHGVGSKSRTVQVAMHKRSTAGADGKVMRISVILSTFNRCQYLRGALESVARSEFSEAVEWEVLIVDNNSSDQTPEVAKEFVVRYPGRFRYLFEPRQGKSYALNTGIRESQGDVVAFLDDDVTVAPTWLRNLTMTLETGEWAGAGGRTLIPEPCSVPRWLALAGPHSLGGFLAAVFDLGDKPCELNRAPFGTNMAYRKEMFEKYGCFRTDLGPSADRNIPHSHDDLEFGRRLLAAGERLRYEPSAIVHHLVHKDRIRKDFFLASCFDSGRGLIRSLGEGPEILGIQRRYWKIGKLTLMVLPAKMLRWMLSSNSQARFSRKCLVWMTAGQIRELYRQPGAAKAPAMVPREMN
jgi:glucosyl-dolichyl phosphate glucuronosyltransferase